MDGRASILIVEDECDLSELIRINLEREGFRCRCVGDGRTAIETIDRDPPDLVILDRMLPGVSGDEVLRHVRSTKGTVLLPVLMLTAKAEEADELVGFALGADDYVTKPFSVKSLIARVRALLRRSRREETDGVVRAGPLVLDGERFEATVRGRPVALTATEFRLLRSLVQAGGRVCPRERLIDQALGPGVAVTDRTIDVHIAALRKKLGEAAAWIRTVRGAGYAFREPD